MVIIQRKMTMSNTFEYMTVDELFMSDDTTPEAQEGMLDIMTESEKEIYHLYTKEKLSIEEKNIELWDELRHYFIWYPDVFYDLMGDLSESKIRFHEDQRIDMRGQNRYQSAYSLRNRRGSKSFGAVAAELVKLMVLPNRSSCYVCKELNKSVKILSEKMEEMLMYFPFLHDELKPLKYNSDKAFVHNKGNRCIIEFKNGSRLQATSADKLRGLTINGKIITDEYFWMDVEELNNSAKPALTPRINLHGEHDPLDFMQLVFLSSAGMRDHPADHDYKRALEAYADGDSTFSFYANWMTSLRFDRAITMTLIKELKKSMPPVMFDINYETLISGAGKSSAVPLEKLFEARTLDKPEVTPVSADNDKVRYFISVDYARSEQASGDQAVLIIGKAYFQNKTTCYKLDIVNIVPIPKTLSTDEQNLIIKKFDKIFNPHNVLVDKNVMGQAFVDDLRNVHFEDGEEYPAFIDIETDWEYEIDTNNTKEHLFGVKTNYYDESQTDILRAYQEGFRTGKIKILKSLDEVYYPNFEKAELMDLKMPHHMTDKLINENMNHKIVMEESGNKLRIKRNRDVKKVGKGRRTKDILMSIAYMSWFVFDKFPKIYGGAKKSKFDWKKYTGHITKRDSFGFKK